MQVFEENKKIILGDYMKSFPGGGKVFRVGEFIIAFPLALKL